MGRPENPSIRLSVKDGIAEIFFDLFNEKINVLRASVMEELKEALAEVSRRSDIHCLLVKSAKPGNFIAGADLREIGAVSDQAAAAMKSGMGQEVCNTLADLPFPTIAVMDGAALGGGLEVALACDYRIVTDNPKTRLGLPETSLGIIPGFGGTYRLPRVVGLSQAVAMILTGKPVDGIKAARIGLADACYPAAFLNDKTEAFVRKLLDAHREKRPRRKGKRTFDSALLESTPFGRALIFRKARKESEKKSGRHYPALGEALRVLRKTVHSGRDKALVIERDAISRLIPTPVTRNLVGLFFSQEAAKRLPAVPSAGDAVGSRQIKRAAVLGAGVMGGKIAWLFTNNGIPVVMKDIAWDAIQKGYSSAFGVYRELAKRRRLNDRQINLKMHHLSGTVEYAGLGCPDIVIEAVVEKLAVKKKVLSEVESHVREDAILASNTSSLSITDMSAALKSPRRFIGMHFFNPPNVMPLVEIIPSSDTSPETVREACRAALMLGKTPIVVRDRPGFLVNRLLLSYLNECIRLVEEGMDYVRLDRLAVDFGLPMGPFTLLDEIGLDVAREVAEVLHAAYGASMEAGGIFSAFSDHPGLLGKKSGRGFYVHGKGKRTPNPEMLRLISEKRRGRAAFTVFDALHRPLLAMVNEASRALEENVVSSAEELDLAMILGTGFPPFRGGPLRYADELGLKRVRDLLGAYASTYGDRFTPATLIEGMAAENKGFYARG